MRKLLLTLTFGLITTGVSSFSGNAQVVDVEAVVRSVRAVKYPAEARETGLEGVVTVPVDVDEKGKVTRVGEAAGPDWACPNVTRADVVAMSETVTYNFVA
jgi:hypothetical protein